MSSIHDRVSLAGGLGCLLFAGILGLDELGAIGLSVGLAAAAICAVAGLVLVVSGLTPGPPASAPDREEG